MNDKERPAQGQLDELRAVSRWRWQSCRLVGALIQWLVVGSLLDYLLFDGTPIGLTLRLGAVGVLLIGTLSSKAWLLLIAIQVSVFLRERGQTDMSVGVDTLLFCCATVFLVAYVYSGQMARRHVGFWFARLAMARPAQEGMHADHRFAINPGWVAMQASALGISILISTLMMIRLPIREQTQAEWLQRSISGDNILWPGALAVVLIVALVVIVREATWRQMTPPQARMYLRSTFLREHYSDLQLVVGCRVKLRRKAAAAETSGAHFSRQQGK